MERAVDVDLGPFFDRCVRGREDPDLAGALAGVGLTLRAKAEKPPEGEAERPASWLGAHVRESSGRLVVAAVLAGSPAEDGGIYAADELVAVDGWRVADERQLGERIAARRPGEAVRLTLFRREEETRVEVVLGDKPPAWEVVPAEGAGESERSLYEGWLGEAWAAK
jgi:predicted metalloprotease with PDZ domain